MTTATPIEKAETYGLDGQWQFAKKCRMEIRNCLKQKGFEDLGEDEIDSLLIVLHHLGYIQ